MAGHSVISPPGSGTNPTAVDFDRGRRFELSVRNENRWANGVLSAAENLSTQSRLVAAFSAVNSREHGSV
jgi:hypothetical protein